MCRDTGTLLFQTAAGMSMNLSASHLCRASAHSLSVSTHRPELMTAFLHLHPIMTRMLRQLKMFTPIPKKPPCSTKWPVFSLMGLLIRATLFMCVLTWRWAQAVILEGDQPCLGLLNLMENLSIAFAFSQSNRLGTESPCFEAALLFWLPTTVYYFYRTKMKFNTF